MAKRPGPKAECGRCGRSYRKCRRNRHTQKYCLHEACVRERTRERQRRYYRNKYEADETFAEAERERCGKSLKARREALREDPELAPQPPPDVMMTILGIVGSLTDAKDAQEVTESLRRFEERGRRVAVFAPLARGAPRQKKAARSSTSA